MDCTAVLLGKDSSRRTVKIRYPPYPSYIVPVLKLRYRPFGQDPPIDRPTFSQQTFSLRRDVTCADVKWRKDHAPHPGYTQENAFVYLED